MLLKFLELMYEYQCTPSYRLFLKYHRERKVKGTKGNLLSGNPKYDWTYKTDSPLIAYLK